MCVQKTTPWHSKSPKENVASATSEYGTGKEPSGLLGRGGGGGSRGGGGGLLGGSGGCGGVGGDDGGRAIQHKVQHDSMSAMESVMLSVSMSSLPMLLDPRSRLCSSDSTKK